MTRSTVPSARRYPSVPSSAQRLLTSFAHFQSSSVFLLFIRVHDTFRQMDPECFLLRGLPFHVLGGVNQSPEAFHLDEVHFISVFSFMRHAFRVLRNLCRGHEEFLSPRIFFILAFTFRSVICLELIFVCGVT